VGKTRSKLRAQLKTETYRLKFARERVALQASGLEVRQARIQRGRERNQVFNFASLAMLITSSSIARSHITSELETPWQRQISIPCGSCLKVYQSNTKLRLREKIAVAARLSAEKREEAVSQSMATKMATLRQKSTTHTRQSNKSMVGELDFLKN